MVVPLPADWYQAKNVYSTLKDNAGKYWINTTGGIYQYDPNMEKLSFINPQYALSANDFDAYRIFFPLSNKVFSPWTSAIRTMGLPVSLKSIAPFMISSGQTQGTVMDQPQFSENARY